MFISLFIDLLAFLRVFEINNSQQKSDRRMKISTFPAVKPFIKLTRGRIDAAEERRGKVTFGEGAEQEESRCSMRQQEGEKDMESDAENRSGTEARRKKQSLFQRRVIWRIEGQTEKEELCVSLKRRLEIERRTSLTLQYK